MRFLCYIRQVIVLENWYVCIKFVMQLFYIFVHIHQLEHIVLTITFRNSIIFSEMCLETNLFVL